MSYKGIDYGNGRTNIDPKVGIRYGVISAGRVDWWCEEAEPIHGPPTCPKCGGKARDISEAPTYAMRDDDWEVAGFDFYCLDCEYAFEAEEAYGEPEEWVCLQGDFRASQDQDDTDIFVTKSPYYTRAQFCSPCAPGACHLEYPIFEGEKVYCFNHEWFEGGVAPYPVYRVSDDSLVEPENATDDNSET